MESRKSVALPDSSRSLSCHGSCEDEATQEVLLRLQQIRNLCHCYILRVTNRTEKQQQWFLEREQYITTSNTAQELGLKIVSALLDKILDKSFVAPTRALPIVAEPATKGRGFPLQARQIVIEE